MAASSIRRMIDQQQLLSGIRGSGVMLANAALFQVTWFACVLGGAADAPAWGFVGVLALLAFSWSVGLLQRDLRILATLGLAGFVADSAWIYLGILDYGDRALAPSWIVALWFGFALTVNHSMSWLQQRPVLAALLAAVFAPITYLAGARFGAVEVADPMGLAIISAAWAVMFTVLFSSAYGAQETGPVR